MQVVMTWAQKFSIREQAGIFGAIWLAEKFGIAARPDGVRWRQIYGASMLCGIGFTMSLFIGALAFSGSPQLVDEAKVGILGGSLLSAFCATGGEQSAGHQ